MLKTIAVLAAAAALSTSAYAAEVTGEWAQADGKSKVMFAPCGNALCGALSWVKDKNGPGKVGERVFYDMKPTGEGTWAGKAFNPEDGGTYSGKMTLNGDHLTTAGCVFGGFICKTFEWTRVK